MTHYTSFEKNAVKLLKSVPFVAGPIYPIYRYLPWETVGMPIGT